MEPASTPPAFPPGVLRTEGTAEPPERACPKVSEQQLEGKAVYGAQAGGPPHPSLLIPTAQCGRNGCNGGQTAPSISITFFSASGTERVLSEEKKVQDREEVAQLQAPLVCRACRDGRKSPRISRPLKLWATGGPGPAALRL